MYFIFVCVCLMFMSCAYVWVPTEARRGCRIPCNWSVRCCESTDVDAENQSRTLCQTGNLVSPARGCLLHCREAFPVCSLEHHTESRRERNKLNFVRRNEARPLRSQRVLLVAIITSHAEAEMATERSPLGKLKSFFMTSAESEGRQASCRLASWL